VSTTTSAFVPNFALASHSLPKRGFGVFSRRALEKTRHSAQQHRNANRDNSQWISRARKTHLRWFSVLIS